MFTLVKRVSKKCVFSWLADNIPKLFCAQICVKILQNHLRSSGTIPQIPKLAREWKRGAETEMKGCGRKWEGTGRSPLSRQNRWQLPLSVLGSIIATASCTALRSGTSTVSKWYRTRRLSSCTRLLSRRAPWLCVNSCTRYRSDNGSRTSWRPLLSRQSTAGPSRTASRQSGCQNTSLYYLSTVLPTIYVHLLRLSSVLLLCTSSLELSRDLHMIGEHFQ